MIVVIVSLAITVFAYQTEDLYYAGSDHFDYLAYAAYLLGLPDSGPVPWRTPGMGLFHILIGTLQNDTWFGLEISFAIFAFLMPVLAYLIVAPYGRWVAMVCGVLVACGYVPYAYSRVASVDQLFFFLNFLSLYLMSLYLRLRLGPWTGLALIVLIVATIAFATLARPVAALYFWIFAAIVFAFAPGRRIPALVGCLLYAAIMAGWALWDRDYGAGGGVISANVFPLRLELNGTLEKRIAEAYYEGSGYTFAGGPAKAGIKPEDGPASAELYASVRRQLVARPDLLTANSELTPEVLFRRVAGEPQAATDRLFQRQNAMYLAFIIRAVRTEYGDSADGLFESVAREQGVFGLSGAVRFLVKSPMRLLVGAPPPMGNRNFLALFYYSGWRGEFERNYTLKQLPPTMLRASNGPASEEIVEANRFFIHTYPQAWPGKSTYFEPYRDKPDEFHSAIFDIQPPYWKSGLYEGFYTEVLYWFYGVGRANSLFSAAAMETIRNFPNSILVIWDNVLHLLLVRDFGSMQSGWNQTYFLGWSDIYYSERHNVREGLSPGLKSELVDVVKASPYVKFSSLGYGAMHKLNFIFVILAAMLFALCMVSTARLVVLMLSMIYLYNIAVIAVFGNFSALRYEDVFVSLPIMVSMIGIACAVKAFRAHTTIRAETAKQNG